MQQRVVRNDARDHTASPPVKMLKPKDGVQSRTILLYVIDAPHGVFVNGSLVGNDMVTSNQVSHLHVVLHPPEVGRF